MVFWLRIIAVPFALALIFTLLGLYPAGLVFCVTGLILLLWKIPVFQIEDMKIPEKERFKYEDRARKTLTQIMAGIVLIIGVYFLWQTYEIEKKDRITKNFSLAINQLGARGVDDGSMGKVIGAIYTLEEIAADHQGYHWKAMEIISAYVRHNAPWKPGETVAPPSEDIKAIITVIGRRNWLEDEVWPINLSGANLQKIHLHKAHLEKAVLDNVNLSDANLSETLFQNAFFRNARLDGASLWKADLREADFEGASFDNVNIKEADLRDAKNLSLRQIKSSCWSNITRFSMAIKIKLKSHRIKPPVGCPEKQVVEKKILTIKQPKKKQIPKKKTKKKTKKKAKKKTIKKKVEPKPDVKTMKMPKPVSEPIEGDIIVVPMEENKESKSDKRNSTKSNFFSDDDDND